MGATSKDSNLSRTHFQISVPSKKSASKLYQCYRYPVSFGEINQNHDITPGSAYQSRANGILRKNMNQLYLIRTGPDRHATHSTLFCWFYLGSIIRKFVKLMFFVAKMRIFVFFCYNTRNSAWCSNLTDVNALLLSYIRYLVPLHSLYFQNIKIKKRWYGLSYE